MPTSDYNSAALIYKALFDALNRVQTTALVPEDEEYNRDEILHFIEDKFKTGIQGGITPQNLRAILHTIVKSTFIKQDDLRQSVLAHWAWYINTGNASRWYFGNFTYGWTYSTWTQYISNATLDSSNLPTISGIFSHMGIVTPFALYNLNFIS